MAKRTGASRIADVDEKELRSLNAGQIEAATLAENLAMDFDALMAAVFPAIRPSDRKIDPSSGITRRMQSAALAITHRLSREEWIAYANHPSDTVRGWIAYATAARPGVSLEERIAAMLPFADDRHFGVREWSWLALRPHVVNAPLDHVAALKRLASDPSANIRRFAVEATRPRGVWSAHIALLKQEPCHALPLLQVVRADPSRYVQDSVGNWLNDAWKTAPEWVEGVCAQWGKDDEATAYIVGRALRNARKS